MPDDTPDDYKHKNQPHQTPVRQAGGLTFSRSAILGTGPGKPPWTMFMPGQSKGSKDEYPTDWPKEGKLLRVPKCVFLTSCPPIHLWGKNFTLMSKWMPFGYLGHWHDAPVRDIRYKDAIANPYGTLIFGGFTGTYDYLGWTIDPRYADTHPEWDGRRKFHKCEVVQNAIYYEHYRLIAAFDAAKKTLESRYPGEVFVEVTEFFPRDPKMTKAPRDELDPLVFDIYTESGYAANAPKHGTDGPVWLLGPDNGQYPMEFLGTNFLHIYAGYQTEGGSSDPRNADDIFSRYHYPNRVFGYKLDRNFGPGYTEWKEVTAVPSGYLDWAEDATFNTVKSDMGKSLSYEDALNGVVGGKLDKLRLGWPNFAGYRVALHEYDRPFIFPGAHFLPEQKTEMPPKTSGTYGDADWVEQTVIIAYSTRKRIYEESHDPYGDQYFPGPEGLLGDGVYNLFVRYPGTDIYVDIFVPMLNAQHDLLKKALESLGPGTKRIWERLNNLYGLEKLGIAYNGGSSTLTADSIVQMVEEHYGLGG